MSLRRTKRSANILLRKSRSDFGFHNEEISKTESGYDEVEDGTCRDDIGADLRSIGNKYDKLVLKMFGQRSHVRKDFSLIRKEAKSLRNELKFVIMKHDGSTAFKKGYKPEAHEVERVVKAEVVTKEMGQLEMALADLMAKYYYLLEQTKTLKDVNSLWHIRSVMKSDLVKRGLNIASDESGAFRSDLRGPIVNRDADNIKAENNLLVEKVRWLNRLSQEFRADLTELISTKVALLNNKASLEKEYDLKHAKEVANKASIREKNVDEIRQMEMRIVDGLKRRIAALDRISDALKVAMIQIGFEDLENSILGASNSKDDNNNASDDAFKVEQVVETECLTKFDDIVDETLAGNSRTSQMQQSISPCPDNDSEDCDDEGEFEEVQVRYVRLEDVDEDDLRCLSPSSRRRFSSKEGALFGNLAKYKSPANSNNCFDATESHGKPIDYNEGFYAAEDCLTESPLVWCRSDECHIDRSDSNVTLTEGMDITCMKTDGSRGNEAWSREVRSEHVFYSRDTENRSHDPKPCDTSGFSKICNQSSKLKIGNEFLNSIVNADDSQGSRETEKAGERKVPADNQCAKENDDNADEIFDSAAATRQDRFVKAKNYFKSYCYSEGGIGERKSKAGDNASNDKTSGTGYSNPDSNKEPSRAAEVRPKVVRSASLNHKGDKTFNLMRKERIGLDSEDEVAEVELRRKHKYVKVQEEIRPISVFLKKGSFEDRLLGLNDIQKTNVKDEASKDSQKNSEQLKRSASANNRRRPVSALLTTTPWENDCLGQRNNCISGFDFKANANASGQISERKTSLSVLETVSSFGDNQQEFQKSSESRSNDTKLSEVNSKRNLRIDMDLGRAKSVIPTSAHKEEKIECQIEKEKCGNVFSERNAGQIRVDSKNNETKLGIQKLNATKKPIAPEDRPVYYNPDGVWPSIPKQHARSLYRSNTMDSYSRGKPERPLLRNANATKGAKKKEISVPSTLPRSLKTAQSPKKSGIPKSPIAKVRPRSTAINTQGTENDKSVSSLSPSSVRPRSTAPNANDSKNVTSYTLSRNRKTKVERSKSCVGDVTHSTSSLKRRWNTATTGKSQIGSPVKTGRCTEGTYGFAKVGQKYDSSTLPRGIKIGNKGSNNIEYGGHKPEPSPTNIPRRPKGMATVANSPSKQQSNRSSLPLMKRRHSEGNGQKKTDSLSRCKKIVNQKATNTSIEAAFDKLDGTEIEKIQDCDIDTESKTANVETSGSSKNALQQQKEQLLNENDALGSATDHKVERSFNGEHLDPNAALDASVDIEAPRERLAVQCNAVAVEAKTTSVVEAAKTFIEQHSSQKRSLGSRLESKLEYSPKTSHEKGHIVKSSNRGSPVSFPKSAEFYGDKQLDGKQGCNSKKKDADRDSWAILNGLAVNSESQTTADNEKEVLNVISYNGKKQANGLKDSNSPSKTNKFDAVVESKIISDKSDISPVKTVTKKPLDQNENKVSQSKAVGDQPVVKKKKRKLIVRKKRPSSSLPAAQTDSSTKQNECKKQASRVEIITGKATSWMQSAFRRVSSDSKNSSKSQIKTQRASQDRTRPASLVEVPKDIARPASSTSSKRGSAECQKSMIPVPAIN